MCPVTTTRRRQSTLIVLFIFLQALLTVDAISSSTAATISGRPPLRRRSTLTGTRSSPTVTRPATISYLQPTTAQRARSQLAAESELHNITLDYIGSTNAALSWYRPLNGTIGNFFVVEWKEGNSNSSYEAKAGQSTRYELQQLHPNTNYTVTVYLDRNGNRSVYTVDSRFKTETAEKPSIIIVDVSNSSFTVNVSGTTDNMNLTCSSQSGIANYTNMTRNSAYVFDNLLAGHIYTIELPTFRHFNTTQRKIYTRPNIPDLITIVNISSNMINLKWRLQTYSGVKPTVILQYHLHDSELYYEQRSPQENVIIGGGDKSFLPGHTYSISIFALLDGLESDHAHLVVTTRPLTPKWKKSEIYDHDGKARLTWTTDGSSYQDSFNISFTDYNDNNVRTLRTVTVENASLWTEIEGLVPGAKYEFSICACSRNSCSEYTQLSNVMKPLRPSVYVESTDERSALLVFRSQSQLQHFIYYSVSILPTGLAKRYFQVNITSRNHSDDFVYNLTGLFPGQSYTVNISTVTVDGVTSEDNEVVAFTTIPLIDITVTQLLNASTSDTVTIQYSIGSSSACDYYNFTINRYSTQGVDCHTNTGTRTFEGLAHDSEHTLYYEAVSGGKVSRDSQLLKVYTAPAHPTGLICDTSNNTLTVCIPRHSTNVDHYTIKLYNLNSTGSDTEPINTSCNTVSYNDTDQECEIVLYRASQLTSVDITPTDDNRCFLCDNSTYHDGDSNECSGENVSIVNENCSSNQRGNVGMKVCNSSGDACNAMMKCDQRGVGGCYSVMMCKFKDDGVGYENCTSALVVNKVSETTTRMPSEEQCKNEKKLVFDNLDAITTYRFDVTAVWRGLHSSTETLSCVTRETLPGPVMDLRVTKLEPNYLALSWNEPKSKSGRLLSYNVALFLIQDELLKQWSGTTEVANKSFDNLAADKTYVVEVAAVTSVGTGPNTSLNVTLPIKAPFVKNMSAVTMHHSDHDHFMVQLVNPFTDMNGQVVSYSVVIAQKSSRLSLHNGEVEKCPSGFHCRIIVNKCQTLFAEGFDADHCWKSDIPERSPGSTKLLQVGKEENCKERTHCNYKLEPSTEYFLFIRGYNRLDEFKDSPLSQPIKTDPQPSDPTSVILITVVIFLVITAAAIIIFLYFRWHNPPLKALNRYARQNTIRMAALPSLSSKPIGAYDFVEHVTSLEKDSGLLFSDEFEELKFVGRDQSCEEAELQCNRAKNRFTNILPYDNTRVKLLPVEDVEGSDYINANWIPGFISKREFIATQGPLPSTKDDFWRLIWEYNCRAVVMLTLCMENGRIKCDQYWPMDAEPVFYGDLEIKIMNETITNSWHIRELQISLGEQSRRIKHFHYLEWPDMKVPDQLSMLAFVHQVRSYVNSKVGGPIVVHCSAGVGRSGTFIALDVLLQQLEHDDVVDVYGVVCRMRLGRVLMVQTEQQYIFVYECMKHVLLEQLVKLHDKEEDSSPAVHENSCASTEPNNDSGSEASEASDASEANDEKNTESDNAEDEGIDDNTVSC